MNTKILEYCIKGLKHISENDWTFENELCRLKKVKAIGKNTVELYFVRGSELYRCVTSKHGKVRYDGFHDTLRTYTEQEKRELEALFQHAYYENKTSSKRAKLRLKKMKRHVCPVCGKEFMTTLSKKRFCSVECAYEFQKASQKERIARNAKVRVCKECGKEFTSKKFQVFCCSKCRIKYWNKIYYSKLSILPKIKTVKTCPVCNKEFEVTSEHRKYCSTECTKKVKSKTLS